MEVGVVIVTYNPQISILKSLLENAQKGVKKTVIVDNNSFNITEIEVLTKQFKNVEILHLADNKGIGYAQNRGIEKVFQDKLIDAVVLFDHDSEPTIDMIDTLRQGYQSLVENGTPVSAVGPIFFDPRTQNNYPISIFKGFQLIKKFATDSDNTPISASFLIASGSFIPRKIIELVGLMKEEFFIDYIDIEWSFRASSLGYTPYVIPFAKMEHRVGDDRIKILGREISIHSPLRRYYLARNSILMLKEKHINWKYKVREVYYSVSRVVVYLLLVKNRFVYLKYILSGWYDGITNKNGKTNRF